MKSGHWSPARRRRSILHSWKDWVATLEHERRLLNKELREARKTVTAILQGKWPVEESKEKP